jgi:methionine transaminase
MHIQSKLPNIGTTIFTTISALANKHNAINLGQGFADYDMNHSLCNLVHKYMLLNKNQYAPMPGIMELRQAICSKTAYLYNKSFDADTEITISPGGTYAIYTALATIVNPGDEVIVLEPAYDCYIPTIELHGGIAIRVPLQLPNFSVNWQLVIKAITPKTRAIIINTPNNPGGYCFTLNDWEQLQQIVQNTNIVIISDEVYEHILLDNNAHQSILMYPALWPRTYAVFSFGKVFHNTGWKIGYCIAPQALMHEYRKVHQYLAFSVNTPMQYALAEYLSNKDTYMQLPNFFTYKHNLFLNNLADSKFTIFKKAAGSFFQTVGYEQISNMDDVSFCKHLIEKYGVACIPVSAFYKDKTDNKLIRFCFAKKDDTLKAAANQLCQVV